MYVPDIELHETASLAEASDLLRRHAPNARFLAGGTDVLVDLKAGRTSAQHLISLNRIEALRGITTTDEGLRIGALTTVTELGRDPVVRERFSAILDAATRMAAPPIRNVATVGGNIISAVPCADLPPILMVMGARVVVWSPAGEREVPLGSMFVGPRQTALTDGEVLSAVIVPELKRGFGAAYARFGLREGNAIAVAAVAAGMQLNDSDTVEGARVVLGAVAPLPKEVPEAGAQLVGQPPVSDRFADAGRIAKEAAEPICDVRGTAEFRRELVEVLTRRALQTARERATESMA